MVPILTDAFSLGEALCAPSQVELRSQITLGVHAVCHLAILIYQQMSGGALLCIEPLEEVRAKETHQPL